MWDLLVYKAYNLHWFCHVDSLFCLEPHVAELNWKLLPPPLSYHVYDLLNTHSLEHSLNIFHLGVIKKSEYRVKEFDRITKITSRTYNDEFYKVDRLVIDKRKWQKLLILRSMTTYLNSVT